MGADEVDEPVGPTHHLARRSIRTAVLTVLGALVVGLVAFEVAVVSCRVQDSGSTDADIHRVELAGHDPIWQFTVPGAVVVADTRTPGTTDWFFHDSSEGRIVRELRVEGPTKIGPTMDDVLDRAANSDWELRRVSCARASRTVSLSLDQSTVDYRADLTVTASAEATGFTLRLEAKTFLPGPENGIPLFVPNGLYNTDVGCLDGYEPSPQGSGAPVSPLPGEELCTLVLPAVTRANEAVPGRPDGCELRRSDGPQFSTLLLTIRETTGESILDHTDRQTGAALSDGVFPFDDGRRGGVAYYVATGSRSFELRYPAAPSDADVLSVAAVLRLLP